MPKYADLVDIYKSVEGEVESLEKGFEDTLREGFSKYLDCQPELINSELTGRPKATSQPVITYNFEVSLDVVLDDYPTKRLSAPLRVVTKPGNTDISKLVIRIGVSNGSDYSYQLNDELYEALYRIFKAKLL